MLKHFRCISPSFVFFNNLQKHQPHQPGHKKTGTALFAVPAYVENKKFSYLSVSIRVKNSSAVYTAIELLTKSFLLRVTIQSACSSTAERYCVASS